MLQLNSLAVALPDRFMWKDFIFVLMVLHGGPWSVLLNETDKRSRGEGVNSGSPVSASIRFVGVALCKNFTVTSRGLCLNATSLIYLCTVCLVFSVV